MRILGTVFKVIGVAATLLMLLGLGAVLMTGNAIQSQDELRKADAILVLGGSVHRPQHAAALYREGYAPKVYVSKTLINPDREVLARVDIDLPPGYEINRRLLTKYGVPDKAIWLYGNQLASTAAEAKAFGHVFPKAERIILVTSPYHVFRAKLIFQRLLPDVEVLGTSTPDEPFPARWWADRRGAQQVVLETIKLAWFAVGGRF